MKRCLYPNSCIHEVVVLENILRERVRCGVFAELTVVLHRILPTDVIRYICSIAYPMARSAHRSIGEGVFMIEYTNDSVTTFYRV